MSAAQLFCAKPWVAFGRNTNKKGAGCPRPGQPLPHSHMSGAFALPLLTASFARPSWRLPPWAFAAFLYRPQAARWLFEHARRAALQDGKRRQLLKHRRSYAGWGARPWIECVTRRCARPQAVAHLRLAPAPSGAAPQRHADGLSRVDQPCADPSQFSCDVASSCPLAPIEPAQVRHAGVSGRERPHANRPCHAAPQPLVTGAQWERWSIDRYLGR